MPTQDFPISTNTDDGTGYKEHTSWPPGAGTWNDWSNDPSNALWCTKVTPGGAQFFNDMTFLRWTLALGADTLVIAAALKMYVMSKTDGESFGLVGDYYDFGGEPTVAGDWVETASPSIFSVVDLGAITTGAVNTFNLTDLSGINPNGTFGIRLTLSAGTPAGDNSVEFAALEHATLQEPRLQLTWLESGAITGLTPYKQYAYQEIAKGPPLIYNRPH